MPRRGKLDKDTWISLMRLTNEITGRILDSNNNYGIAGPMRIAYYGFGLKVRSILNHGGGQAEIDNAIKYFQNFSGTNPNILRIIADKMQGKPTTEQC